MTNEVMLAMIAAIQGISLAYINRQIKSNACGGARCIKALRKALVPLRKAGPVEET